VNYDQLASLDSVALFPIGANYVNSDEVLGRFF